MAYVQKVTKMETATEALEQKYQTELRKLEIEIETENAQKLKL